MVAKVDAGTSGQAVINKQAANPEWSSSLALPGAEGQLRRQCWHGPSKALLRSGTLRCPNPGSRWRQPWGEKGTLSHQ